MGELPLRYRLPAPLLVEKGCRLVTLDIRGHGDNARRVASVCSGAFLLAAASLLPRRRAATHGADRRQLDATYVDVTLKLDAIEVHDGNVWNSAGVTAGVR